MWWFVSIAVSWIVLALQFLLLPTAWAFDPVGSSAAATTATPATPPLAAPLGPTSREVDADGSLIQIAIGDRIQMSITGLSPSIENDELVRVRELGAGLVELEGLAGGTTQLLVWRDGQLQSYLVEVVLPEQIQYTSIGPRFKSSRGYFIYNFTNSSSFSEEQFFQNPIYNHSLSAYSPFLGGSLQPLISYRHGDGLVDEITDGRFVFQRAGMRLAGGVLFPTFSQGVSESLFGATLFGGELQLFNNPTGGRFRRSLHLFGGVKRPTDLRNIEVKDQIQGGSFHLTRQRPGSFFSDLLGVTAFRYQPPNEQTFQYGGSAEAQWHLARTLTVGAGVTRAQGGMTWAGQQMWERRRGLTRTRYAFVPHGIQSITGTPTQNNHHRYEISNYQYLGDGVTLLSSQLSHDLQFQRGDSTQPGSNALGSQITVQRQFSARRTYGLTYSFSRAASDSSTTLGNGIAANFTHPFRKHSVFNHSMGYSRSDLASRSDGITVSSLLLTERTKVRSLLAASTTIQRGSTNNESSTISEQLQWHLPRGTLQLGVLYQKGSWRDNGHQFLVVPSLLYNVTSTHLLAVNSSASLTLGAGGGRQFNGGMGIQYQHYFGPGIDRDSIFRVLVGRGGGRRAVSGDLFLDINFNAAQDDGEQSFAGVPITLDRASAKTDASGHFKFGRVKAGEHTLSFDPAALGLTEEVETVAKQTFTTDGTTDRIIPLPVYPKRATITVRMVLDTNANKQVDMEDLSVSIPKVVYYPPTGEPRKVSTRRMAGAIIRGVELGRARVAIDGMDIPDNVELIGPVEQSVQITAHQEYEIGFFFKPIRAVQGRVSMARNAALPRGLRVILGPHASSVDAQGYFWIENVTPGSHPLDLRGLPAGHCPAASVPKTVTVGAEALAQQIDILVISDCGGR